MCKKLHQLRGIPNPHFYQLIKFGLDGNVATIIDECNSISNTHLNLVKLSGRTLADTILEKAKQEAYGQTRNNSTYIIEKLEQYINKLKQGVKMKLKLKNKEVELNDIITISEVKVKITPDFIKDNIELFDVVEELTAEQEANRLGFYKGDKVWHKQSKNYIGVITDFFIGSEGEIVGAFEDVFMHCNLKLLTNKVAILISTKEEFEFIDFRLGSSLHRLYLWDKNTCVLINELNTGKLQNVKKDKYLILTVDEYMKAIGEKLLFVTIDNVKFYKGQPIHIVRTESMKIYSYPVGWLDGWTLTKGITLVFSTKEAAEAYIKENTKPEIGTWYKDGEAYLCPYEYDKEEEEWLAYGFIPMVIVNNDKPSLLEWGQSVILEDWATRADPEKIKSLLLEKVKRDYPKGIKFISADLGDYRISSGEFNYDNKYSERILVNVYNDEHKLIGQSCIYRNGRWAEIISKPKTIENFILDNPVLFSDIKDVYIKKVLNTYEEWKKRD